MNKTQTPEDIAGKRMVMINPLLEEGLDPGRIIELQKKVSVRTITFPIEVLPVI